MDEIRLRRFPAGTPARCNRCDQKSPLPELRFGQEHNSYCWRLTRAVKLGCGHMGHHLIHVADLEQSR